MHACIFIYTHIYMRFLALSIERVSAWEEQYPSCNENISCLDRDFYLQFFN